MSSVWSKSIPINIKEKKEFPAGTDQEAIIIGAGLAGVLAAYFLQKQGIHPVILEADTVGSGVTKETTAKITCGHYFIYHKLLSQLGLEKTQQYALANRLALKQYHDLITEKQIDCGYQELPLYVYTTENEKDALCELEAAKSCYLDVNFCVDIELPILTKGAVCYQAQAQFHPLQFLEALCQELEIYEHTFVSKISGHTLSTNRGSINGKQIILATHYPVFNKNNLLFSRLYQSRSYAMCFSDTPVLQAMYVDGSGSGYNFRSVSEKLLVSGGGHRTGCNSFGGNYKALSLYVKEAYPDAKETMRWSTQDCMTLDGIPYIGRLNPYKPYLYAATGFNKWGMSHSMTAAMLISDMILEKKNPFEEVFSPLRLNYSMSKHNLKEHFKISYEGIIKKRFKNAPVSIEALKNGEAAVIDSKYHHLGAYKDMNGQVHLVSSKCPHMGCTLNWNPEELTWDCPCHGSRLDYDGNIIKSPALSHKK